MGIYIVFVMWAYVAYPSQIINSGMGDQGQMLRFTMFVLKYDCS